LFLMGGLFWPNTGLIVTETVRDLRERNQGRQSVNFRQHASRILFTPGKGVASISEAHNEPSNSQVVLEPTSPKSGKSLEREKKKR